MPCAKMNQIVTYIMVTLPVMAAFSDGAGTNACNLLDMRPTGHYATALENAVTNSSLFMIEVSQTSYTPGGSRLLVTLKNIGGGNTVFKGFLIQGRKPDDRDFLARGKFQSNINSLIRCGSDGKGLTHTKQFQLRGSTTLAAVWEPPSICIAKDIGSIRFQATVVTAFDEPPHLMVFSNIIQMEPMNNSILCQHGCGVHCPARSGAVSLYSSLLILLGVISLYIEY